ncbi:MAG: choline/carnitine O-acyltransferase [Hyphomicrobiaceae bacterium]|nr:choline/carnitine O-acyltransferase [Hyphomicrobiaceae bacterium]
MNNIENNGAPLESKNTTQTMPLPSLEETAEHFTQWFTPLLDNEQRASTRAALNTFIKSGGLGCLLHEELRARSAKSDTGSWLDDYWQSRFLARHDAPSLNDNYFFLFAHEELSREKRAASLAAAVLNYKLVLDQGIVPRAVEKTSPLCERQFAHLFSTTRIPDPDCDHLNKSQTDKREQKSPARHIAVFCQGNIFRLDLISKDGLPHSLKDIEAGFERISLDCLDEQITGRAVGYLTTLQRTDWAHTRKTLRNTSRENNHHLELIESALFSIHLERDEPKDNRAACLELLRGNGGNRWFDKSLQFIVFKNGMAGLNVEHSGLDRATVVDFLDYVLGIDTSNIDQYSGATQQGTPVIQSLTFDLNPSFQKRIAMAGATFEKKKNTIETRTLEFSEFDNALLNRARISQDAFAQCALQLAQWRMNNEPVATCQNISLRQYSGGRVQYMWVASDQMMDFLTLMQEERHSSPVKFESFERAIRQHEARTKACRQGVQPEQHLGELLNIYQRHPEKFEKDFLTRMTLGGLKHSEIETALEFYQSPGWTRMRDDAFCTSFLASPNILHHGFSALDHGNVAVGCLFSDHQFFAHLSVEKEKRVLLGPLIANWREALEELQDLIRDSLEVVEPDVDPETE